MPSTQEEAEEVATRDALVARKLLQAKTRLSGAIRKAKRTGDHEAAQILLELRALRAAKAAAAGSPTSAVPVKPPPLAHSASDLIVDTSGCSTKASPAAPIRAQLPVPETTLGVCCAGKEQREVQREGKSSGDQGVSGCVPVSKLGLGHLGTLLEVQFACARPPISPIGPKTPAGERNFGERNFGERNFGERNFGERDFGERSCGERRLRVDTPAPEHPPTDGSERSWERWERSWEIWERSRERWQLVDTLAWFLLGPFGRRRVPSLTQQLCSFFCLHSFFLGVPHSGFELVVLGFPLQLPRVLLGKTEIQNIDQLHFYFLLWLRCQCNRIAVNFWRDRSDPTQRFRFFVLQFDLHPRVGAFAVRRGLGACPCSARRLSCGGC